MGGGPAVTLDADVELTVGELHLSATVSTGDDVIAVVGPNGAGKTTLLRAIAGLEPLGRGRVTIDGAVVEDTATGVRVHRRTATWAWCSRSTVSSPT